MSRSPFFRLPATAPIVTLLAVLMIPPATAEVPSDTPLVSATTTTVKPNMMFILDDSGSMEYNAVPDSLATSGTSTYNGMARSFQCNPIYYNPATTYTPPVTFTSNTHSTINPDGSIENLYPDRTLTNACNSDNLNNSRGTCSTDIRSRAYYFVYTGTQLRADGTLNPEGSVCTSSPGSGATFSANGTGGGTWTRYDFRPTITVSGSNSTSVTSIKVGTVELLNAATTANTNSATVASRIAEQINAKTATTGFSATVSGSVVTITGPTSAGGKSLDITKSGNMTVTPSAYFAVGTETNFANWFSYYSTRLRMVKTAAGRAFLPISDRYRVGFITLRPGTSATATASDDKFLPIRDFDDAQKESWYDKLYKMPGDINGTPLRDAVSRVGRYYAGKSDSINNGMINGTTRPDPVQYSCQQNFAILATDGYWNTSVSPGTGYRLDGTQMSSDDNYDGMLSELDLTGKFPISPYPIYDGSLETRTTTDKENEFRATTSGCPIVAQPGSTTMRQEAKLQWRACSETQSSGGNRTCKKWNTTWNNVTSGNCVAVSTASSSTTATDASTTNRLRQCQYTSFTTTSTNDPGCTPVAPSSGPTYTVRTAVQCVPSASIATQKVEYRTYTRTITASFSGGVQQGNSTDSGWGTPSAWVDVPGTSCTPIDQDLTPAGYNPVPARRSANIDGFPLASTLNASCTSWPCIVTSPGSGGAKRTLADVTQYYYKNDLRPLMENNVPAAGTGNEDDRATWQHMTTFTLGLGLSGTLKYSSSYKTDTEGDFAQIRAGTKNWPVPNSGSGKSDSSSNPEKLDDLWHAAVNGRGQFFSASEPDAVAKSLSKALAGVNNRTASAAAASTSTLEPVSGDNFVFIAKYTTNAWTGELEAHTIALEDDPANGIKAGDVSASPLWTAATKLQERVSDACDSRSIKLFRSGAPNNLVDFKWNSDTCTLNASNNVVPSGNQVTTLDSTEQEYFSWNWISNNHPEYNALRLGQADLMGDQTVGSGGPGEMYDQRTAAAGAALVNYLRGQKGNEGADSFSFDETSHNAFFRTRNGVLGDVVNAQPLYVRAPDRNFLDAGYAEFKTAKANRQAVVYLAANDGMLHAFNAAADGGNELWAFIPRAALPGLYQLASTTYNTQHRFFVDGSPVAGDVFDSTCGGTPASCWKTILVGGLNKGGKSYYALDITDPANPKALWEFNDADMGYTYGNPLIGKLADGRWAVFVTSGLNNSGQGYLYVIDAITGSMLYKIGTGAGSAVNPSGLTKLVGWINEDANTNLTFNHIYGVDLMGNVWRFDINDICQYGDAPDITTGPCGLAGGSPLLPPEGRNATLLITLKDAAGNPQPITTRPVAALVGGDIRVFVGTGKFLSEEDQSSTQVQTVYGFRDPMTTPATGPVYTDARSNLAGQVLVTKGNVQDLEATRHFASCTSNTNGWYVDLPDSGVTPPFAAERVNVDMRRAFNSLIFASNIPESSACNVGGRSWLTTLDLAKGCAAPNVPVSQRIADALAVGVSLITIDGQVKAIVQLSDGTPKPVDPKVSTSNPVGRRLSWREVTGN